jgi:hypothetical protein
MSSEGNLMDAGQGPDRRTRRKRLRVARRRAAGLAAATAALGAVATVSAPAAPAAADGPYWDEVQHNIQGADGGHNGALGYARFVRQEIQRLLPVAASVNEVCQSQADYLWGHVSNVYAMYFVVSRKGSDTPTCGDENFGNVILVHKGLDPSRDTTWTGYRALGNPQNSYTHIFSSDYEGGESVEHKRVDCVLVGDSGGVQKWRACTSHLTREDGGNPTSQMNEIRNSPDLVAPTMLMADLNIGPTWVANNINNWRWDTLHTASGTHSHGKIDWVLGRTNYDFGRDDDSVVENKGVDGYDSDHNLLVAYLRAV